MEEVYAWLPIHTIIDNEVLVTHEWVSESKDLNLLHHIERNKMKYVLMPLISIDGDQDTDLKRNKVDIPQGVRTKGSLSERLTKHEWWEQVFNNVWSDPRGKRGCIHLLRRGLLFWTRYYPPIFIIVLNKYQLKMLIRFHEHKSEGYEICHDGKVISVFSASNYYEGSSDRGAYIRLGFGLTLRFFQYCVGKAMCLRSLYQRVNVNKTKKKSVLHSKPNQ